LLKNYDFYGRRKAWKKKEVLMICPHCRQIIPDNNYRCPKCRKIIKEGLDPRDFISKPGKKQTLNLTVLVLIVVIVGLAVMAYFMFQKEAGEGKDNTDIDRSYQPKREVKLDREKRAAARETPVKSNDPWEDATQESFNGQEIEEPGTPGENEPEAEKEEEPEGLYTWVKKESVKKLLLSHTPGEKIDIERLVQRGKTTIIDFYSAYCGPCLRISPLLERLDKKRDDIVVIKIDINRKNVRGIDWDSPVVRQYGLSSIPHFIIYNASGLRTHEGRDAYQQVAQLLNKEGIR
jgi:thiol-disulfide isomerase/thioredoxin